jgi:Tol biopolymer transport system component
MNKELMRLPDFYKLDSFQWLGSNTGFFLLLNKYNEERDEGAGEVWFLDENGNVKWKIMLTDFIKLPSVHNLSVSPDGQYLSFSVETWSGAVKYNDYWLLLDTKTGAMLDYCLSSDYPAVWSPDGKYVAIASGSSNSDEFRTILIDIEHPSIYEIVNGYIPVGWLK